MHITYFIKKKLQSYCSAWKSKDRQFGMVYDYLFVRSFQRIILHHDKCKATCVKANNQLHEP